MRTLREARGYSLRRMENEGPWTRGTMSQVENGRTKPSSALVHWYESVLDSDGLLLTLYADARVGLDGSPVRRPSAGKPAAFRVLDSSPPSGFLLAPGERTQACWTIGNEDAETWTGWSVERLGGSVGTWLIGGPDRVALPVLAPGASTEVCFEVTAPTRPGSTIAYWMLLDSDGLVRSTGAHLSLLLLVDRVNDQDAQGSR